MAIAALHQLKEDVVVNPCADAADTGIKKNIQAARFQHALRFQHCLFGMRVMMEALRTGDDVESHVGIPDITSLEYPNFLLISLSLILTPA